MAPDAMGDEAGAGAGAGVAGAGAADAASTGLALRGARTFGAGLLHSQGDASQNMQVMPALRAN